MVSRGGAVVEILMTGDLNAWIDAYDLPVTTVAPLGPETKDQLGIRESGFIVDLATMTIVWKVNGSIAGIGDSAAKTALPELDARLSQ